MSRFIGNLFPMIWQDVHAPWVPWGAHPTKKMPSVGDVFLLYSDNPEQRMAHVGIIVEVPSKPGEPWVMADGGRRQVHRGGLHEPRRQD